MRIATARNVVHTITALLIGATDVKMEKEKKKNYSPFSTVMCYMCMMLINFFHT